MDALHDCFFQLPDQISVSIIFLPIDIHVHVLINSVLYICMKHLQRNVCLKFIKEKLNFLIIPSFLLDTIQNLNNQVPFDTSTVGTYI